MSGRFQSIILNGKISDWETIHAGASQRSILGPLFFLIYINDRTSNLKSNIKLLADIANILNNDLRKICKKTKQWEMNFNPDPTKQAQKLIFLENHISIILYIYFNSLEVEKVKIQKHLGLKLDEGLNFR